MNEPTPESIVFSVGGFRFVASQSRPDEGARWSLFHVWSEVFKDGGTHGAVTHSHLVGARDAYHHHTGARFAADDHVATLHDTGNCEGSIVVTRATGQKSHIFHPGDEHNHDTACGLPLVWNRFSRFGRGARPWYAAATCLRCRVPGNLAPDLRA